MKLRDNPDLYPTCPACSYAGAELINYPHEELILEEVNIKGSSLILEVRPINENKKLICAILAEKIKDEAKREKLFNWLKEQRGKNLDVICGIDIPFLQEDDLN